MKRGHSPELPQPSNGKDKTSGWHQLSPEERRAQHDQRYEARRRRRIQALNQHPAINLPADAPWREINDATIEVRRLEKQETLGRPIKDVWELIDIDAEENAKRYNGRDNHNS